MGIGMGLSTNIGRLLGQGHASQAARFTSHGLLLAVVLVTIASTLGFFTIEPLFSLLGAKEDSIPLIEQYMQVWYLTIPLLVIPMAGNSAIRRRVTPKPCQDHDARRAYQRHPRSSTDLWLRPFP